MTTTLQSSDAPTVEALQREWLEAARKTKAKDILAQARRTGEKLHDGNLKRLEKDLRLIKQPEGPNESPRVQELRAKYKKGNIHHTQEDPVYTALKPFLTLTGAARERLEEIAREYLSLEKLYLDQLPAQTDQERQQGIRKLADMERAKADMQIAASRSNQTNPPAEEGRTTTRAPRSQPFQLKTLEKTVALFKKRTWQTLRRKDSHCHDDAENDVDEDLDEEAEQDSIQDSTQNDLPLWEHDPGEPEIRFDENSLREICKQANKGDPEIPQDLEVLLIGPKGDSAIAQVVAEITEQHEAQVRERQARDICLAAWDAWNRTQNQAAYRTRPPRPEQLYDMAALTEAWSHSGWEGHMPGYMTYLLKGEEGTRLREESFTAARATLLQKTEDHERNTLHLTDVQRVERRLDAEYRGPTLDLTPEQLQEIWQRSGATGPMPRAWLTQSSAQDHLTLTDWILKSEYAAMTSYRSAVIKHQQAMDQKASRATLRKREKDTLEELQRLMNVHENIDREFGSRGIEPPPKPHHPDVPESEGERPQGKLNMGRLDYSPKPVRVSPNGAKPRDRKQPEQPGSTPIRLF